MRTNYFLPAPQPDPYLTLKFESAKILGLPDTAPLFEIHVNSPRDGGMPSARGQVWRAEEFASAIVPTTSAPRFSSLMKTQTVKNAVIVPTGAKGGFIVKQAAGQPATSNDGVEAYKMLINAMLEVTRQSHRPRRRASAGVKVLDDDGAYLVVAADKGTASFSDIANGHRDRARLLARRRVRLGRRARLRPQENRHHRARRMGIRQAAICARLAAIRCAASR